MVRVRSEAIDPVIDCSDKRRAVSNYEGGWLSGACCMQMSLGEAPVAVPHPSRPSGCTSE